jgi:hypothetical protein
VHSRYRKVVEEYKDIESDFYLNNFSNDDLESKLYKNSWRCSNFVALTIVIILILSYYTLLCVIYFSLSDKLTSLEFPAQQRNM